MLGILSYGAYIPLWRLERSTISAGLKGEKAIAGFDEDSITMATAAGVDCFQNKNIERNSIDGLIFASTTSPYVEKQSASIIAKALDLRRDIFTADSLACLRGGTVAMRIALDIVKAGSAKRALVTAADCRLGAPDSSFEQDSGDGGAALVFGDSSEAIATVVGSYSISNELMDVWRLPGEAFVNTEEDRFIEEEGYLKITEEAISGLMGQSGLSVKDFAKVVLYAPNLRCYRTLTSRLGFHSEQLQDPLFEIVGNTGAAYSLMLLVAALEEVKPGDKILLASYGDGSDVFILETTEHIKDKKYCGLKPYLQSKKLIQDYPKYLKWRKILPVDKGRSVLIPKPSLKEMMRRQDEVLRMHGTRCKVCETVQYPPQRVCTKCHSKDQYDKIRLSDKEGEIYSFTVDYGAGGIEPPIVTFTNLEGGGRVFCILTDASSDSVKIGMPVEFTFRKSYGEILPEYLWKVRPIRIPE
jgi:3-hydroxy-3-methylglutaryl CoA synthase